MLKPSSASTADKKQNTPFYTIAKELSTQMAITRRKPKTTKRTAARIAIMNVIRAGIIPAGELVPPEQELTKILGVSLGTVQAALRELQDIGIIVRKRGDGTRVASGEPFAESIWHFRVADRETGQPLRFLEARNWVDTVSAQGVWSDHLGNCEHYVRIRRILKLQNGVAAGAEMFLDAARVKGLEQIDPSELAHTNIRPYLEKTHGLSTRGSSTLVRTTMLEPATSKSFQLDADVEYFEIHARAHARDQRPTYFQRIFIATGSCALMF